MKHFPLLNFSSSRCVYKPWLEFTCFIPLKFFFILKSYQKAVGLFSLPQDQLFAAQDLEDQNQCSGASICVRIGKATNFLIPVACFLRFVACVSSMADSAFFPFYLIATINKASRSIPHVTVRCFPITLSFLLLLLCRVVTLKSGASFLFYPVKLVLCVFHPPEYMHSQPDSWFNGCIKCSNNPFPVL